MSGTNLAHLNPPRAVPSYAMSDLEIMARAFAASKLFGVQNEQQALALCLVAQAEGRHPASAAQDYHILQGRPAKKADAMLRDFLGAGGKVEWHALDDTQADATFSHPAGGKARIAWDMKRAQAAGLSTPMWKKYPRQMLRSRTVSEGVRTVYPMATSGMYVPEEVQDFTPEPRQAVEAPANQTVIEADFEVTPQPVKSAHQARKDGDFERLNASLNKCATEEALSAWAKDNKDDIGALPRSWQTNIREAWVAKRDELRARAAEVATDPHGVMLDVPDDDTDLPDYLDQVLLIIEGANSTDEIAAAQTLNALGLARCAAEFGESVQDRVASAVESRVAFLEAHA